MSLQKLLKNFCIDAYSELTRIGELPRPPLDVPIIAGNEHLTHPLSKLDSYIKLQQYMRTSGLSDKLHDIGHTRFWHYEVFEWLFLERVIAEGNGTSLNTAAFNKVYNHAQVEISRSYFSIRRVTILNGLPKLSRPIRLCKGVLLSPHNSDLADLLGRRFQDMNREPSLWVNPDNRFLIQTCTISKGNRGSNLDESLKQLRHQANVIIKALRLSIDTPVYPKAVYLSHLSSFPLLPILHKEFEEFSGFSISLERPITNAEIRAILRNFKFINSSESPTPKESGFFYTALNKFSDSFRWMQEKQSILDLFIALEAMYRVERGLRQRLATFTAFLLGTNDKNRRTFYDHVSAGYKLRNAIVHGAADQEQGIYNALTDFFPELKGKPQNKVLPYISKATEELQRIVRLILRAYIYTRHNKTRKEWPEISDFEGLPFDSKNRRLIQKQLGITAKQPAPPSWHF